MLLQQALSSVATLRLKMAKTHLHKESADPTVLTARQLKRLATSIATLLRLKLG